MREQQIFPQQFQRYYRSAISIWSQMKWKTKALNGRHPISLLTCLLIVIPCQPHKHLLKPAQLQREHVLVNKKSGGWLLI